MNMKKLCALALALVMALSLTVTALAEEKTTSPAEDLALTDSAKADVYATFKENATGGNSEIVYNIDVKWGSMKFTYTVNTTETNSKWDPDTHTYSGTTATSDQGTWAVKEGEDADSNEITVTNHSNAGVNVKFAGSPKNSKLNNLTLTVKNGDTDLTATAGTNLETGEGRTVDNADKVVGTVMPEGVLPHSYTTESAIFELTVTLSEVSD